jgi:hypothetical protein
LAEYAAESAVKVMWRTVESVVQTGKMHIRSIGTAESAVSFFPSSSSRLHLLEKPIHCFNHRRVTGSFLTPFAESAIATGKLLLLFFHSRVIEAYGDTLADSAFGYWTFLLIGTCSFGRDMIQWIV